MWYTYRNVVYNRLLGLYLMWDIKVFRLSDGDNFSTSSDNLYRTDNTVYCVYPAQFSWFTYCGTGVLFPLQKFSRCFKAAEEGQLHVFMKISKGVPFMLSCYMSYTVPIPSTVFHILPRRRVIFSVVIAVIILRVFRTFFIYVTFFNAFMHFLRHCVNWVNGVTII